MSPPIAVVTVPDPQPGSVPVPESMAALVAECLALRRVHFWAVRLDEDGDAFAEIIYEGNAARAGVFMDAAGKVDVFVCGRSATLEPGPVLTEEMRVIVRDGKRP
jgi:hypothetical protein